MADIEYDGIGGEVYPSHGTGLTSLINWAGAFLSMALIAGLAYWGYQLMVRDVSGVPVVRALAGPMRVAPEDPGGTIADHQGLAVNNIAAEGSAADPADRLVLAPKPTELREEDQTVGEFAAIQEATRVSAEPDISPASDKGEETDVVLVEGMTSDAEAGEPVAMDQASLIEATLLMVQQPENPKPSLLVSPMAAKAIRADVVPASVAGPSKSLRPQLRPTFDLASLSANFAADAATDGQMAVNSVDPDTIPTGTRLAQLGAFESPEIAEKEWLVLSAKFEDYMADKGRVIQKAQSGGKEFYRLRAHGFEDLSDARRFCSALLAGKANCIPVVTR